MGVVFQVFMFIASTAYQISQQNKMKREADKRKGFNITVSGEASSLPVVYGKAVLGGVATGHKVKNSFVSASDNSDKSFAKGFANTSRSGSKNEYLNVEYALCVEGIEGVQWVKVNDNDYNSSVEKFKHRIRTHVSGGTADAISTANGFAATNRFTGAAHAAASFQLNREDYNYNGVPSMEFLVKGRKVRWVKETAGVYTLSTDFVYSNNPALCLLDYLTNSDFGRGLSAEGIDLKSFYDAANVCDTIVATTLSVSGKVNGQKRVHTVADLGSRPTNLEKHTYENELWYTTASDQYWYWNKTVWVETNLTATRPLPLYECNISLDTGDKIRDNIERIMSTMGLAELTWSSEGKYKLLVEYPSDETALNALVDSGHYFTDDDITRDNIEISWPDASSRLNQATVNFLNEHEDFKEDTMTWPPSYSAVHNQYLTEDNNQPFQADFNSDGITDPYHALAMAEHSVRKARSIFTVKLTVSKKGLNLEPGDFINLQSDVAGLDSDVYRVETIAVKNDLTVDLTVYRFDHTSLAWNVADDIAYAVQPTFDFNLEAPTSGAFDSTTVDNFGTGSGKLTWTAADDVSATEYLVEISNDNGATWQTLGSTRVTTFDIVGLVTGTYDFSIRSKSPVGTLSNRLLVEDNAIQLKTVGKVAVIYADTIDETTNTQSYTLGSNTFVAYYSYDGETPTLPITSGITFTSFIGPTGPDGNDGADGVAGLRGAGWWRYETGTSASTSGLSDVAVNAFFVTSTGLAVAAGDRIVLNNTTDDATGYVRNNANTSWTQQAEFIDGGLMVNGTVTADKIEVTTVSAISSNIGAMTAGTLSSADGNFVIDLNNKTITIST
jgi:hypothetical protein